ncbi:APC family permease [Henriciella sp.]|jgi:amino acid transporter|uniref:APC family permease n=1 Tax=Henriciella sp. TaxID=1968823 RepID=UPI002608A59A|nr:APC family permease [Henriciella sp.]
MAIEKQAPDIVDRGPVAEPARSESHGHALKRTLGTWSIIFMVLAAAAPLTAATGVLPLSILFSANSAAPFYFLVTVAMLALFSVGYTAMSRTVENAGAFYAYIEAGLGRTVGNAAAMLALGAYSLTVLALTAYAGPFASQLAATFTAWDNSPWWLWSLICWAVLMFLGYRDIELSSKVLSVLLVLEVGVVGILGLAILVQGGANGISLSPLSPVQAFDHGSPATGIMWAALCFIGFEATAVFRQEARDPERTIPRATYFSILLIGCLYAFTALAVVLGVGAEDVVETIGSDPTGVLFALASEYVGTWFADVINVLLMGSIFACALSFHNVVNRYQLTMSQGGLLPQHVGQIHHRHRVPSAASGVLSGVVLTALAVVVFLDLDPVTEVFAPLVGILGFAVITLMSLASLSAVFYLRRKQNGTSIFTSTIAPIVALGALVWVLFLSFSNIDVITGSKTGSAIVTSLMIALPVVGAIASWNAGRRKAG